MEILASILGIFLMLALAFVLIVIGVAILRTSNGSRGYQPIADGRPMPKPPTTGSLVVKKGGKTE